LNVIYTCTEDIYNNGQIIAYSIDIDGSLTKMGQVDAGGTSTCYLTIDRAEQNILAVNYWDSTIVVIPISDTTGGFTGPIRSKFDPKGGMQVVAAGKSKGGADHSNNDEGTIQLRQKDPHSHAIVLDPFHGRIAYVPCLGKDLVREFFYEKENGKLEVELNSLPSGLCTGHPDGPRYVVFHPKFNMMYVVNELSSTVSCLHFVISSGSSFLKFGCAHSPEIRTCPSFCWEKVAVFTVNKALIREINEAAKSGESIDRFKGRSTLKLVQSISTIPSAFSKKLNTCGRICLHPSGRFILVSNRGHQSIATLRVRTKGAERGLLFPVGYFHTRGETPRHFAFDNFGQYLLVANQDTDNVSVFGFNQSTGEIKFTGNEYRIPSPNFICCCPLYSDYHDKTRAPLYVYTSSDELEEEKERDDSSSDSIDTFDRGEIEARLAETLLEVERLKKQLRVLTTDL